MPQNAHIDWALAETERRKQTPLAEPGSPVEQVRAHAAGLARSLVWLPTQPKSTMLAERQRAVAAKLRPLLRTFEAPLPKTEISDDFRWAHDNVRLLQSELEDTAEAFKRQRRIPHVRTTGDVVAPRALAVAEAFLHATGCQFSESAFSAYVASFQESAVLNLKELWLLVPALKLALLEQLAVRGTKLLAKPAETHGVGACIRALRDIGQTSWKNVLEPLILFDRVLREDPGSAYPRMDFESRDLYREELRKIAEHSDLTEMEVAAAAVALAQEAQQQPESDARLKLRLSHVGYYLLDAGRPALLRKVGYRTPWSQRVQTVLRANPDELYLSAIEVVALGIVVAILLPLIGFESSFALIVLATLALLLPASQAAVLLANYLITSLLPAKILPKVDCSEGIPQDCATMVAVPSLLLNEQQIRRLAEDLEVRYLGNHDANIYFALLTDLPDSPELALEDDPRVTLCARLVEGLNQKYAHEGAPFLFLHRHRVYNPREGLWMGWERKRGKLLDLNKLLRGQLDSFPVKAGDLSIFPRIRYVITLDADTELPRGSAHHMVGAMAHPLNQAIIDREKNIVVAGYGIMQPRVGVSVQSAARSRMASIYSGETGFDIYTRAVSDVYQDLYGEGIFAGKGIYEVETLRQVLEQRFPRNALLSHDLIEGAYARAGLLSDVEVIEDYPSHYSAYNRRKHRWLRGDWQIAGWLSDSVPDEAGARVPNPISLVSKWKILDNLRRSLVEPAIFVLLVLGWVVLPRSAAYWTAAVLAILFVPGWCRFVFELIRAAFEHKASVAREAWDGLVTANISVLLTLTFLAHQAMLSLDAVIRTLVRRIVTQRRLLQWETAAEAEMGAARRAPVDVYLGWMPVLALALFLLVLSFRPTALLVAFPVLLLWGGSRLVSLWLNRSPHPSAAHIARKDGLFLRRAALRTWRYFAEFSTAEHHWMIPDNVQEEPPAVAGRISPTNLGLLLNARQAACEFGYLTPPELAEQTLRTLATVAGLSRFRGHLFNWYDTRTLEPLSPAFVSSVDNGNFVASLWTLQQGARERLTRPLLDVSFAEGILDYLHALVEFRAISSRKVARLRRDMKRRGWLTAVLEWKTAELQNAPGRRVNPKRAADQQWFCSETRARLEAIAQAVRSYTPWLLPEFAELHGNPFAALKAERSLPSLINLPDYISKLSDRVRELAEKAATEDEKSKYQALASMLPEARSNALRLIESLRDVATTSARIAAEMDFGFFLNRSRGLLSIGYDVEADQLHSACYDLLASESRTALFVAIAKEDIPQESWFRLGRRHTLYHGHPVLLSWSGTMFEYLMPTVWMRSYPGTLMQRSCMAAVRSQQTYTGGRKLPWGISESAYFKMDDAGNYQYHAFGIPSLALREREEQSLVISPYASIMALEVDAPAALLNMRRMANFGWFGAHGFYESADFTPSRRRSRFHRYELVRCWMAHHQGMSLLAISNYLLGGRIQSWFHGDPRVQATELLLHEKPVSHIRPLRDSYETVAG